MGSSMMGAGGPPPRYSNNVGMSGGSAQDPAVIQNAIANSQDPNTVGDLFNRYSQNFNTLQQRQGGSPAIMSALDRGRMSPQTQYRAPSQFATQGGPQAQDEYPAQMGQQEMQRKIQSQFNFDPSNPQGNSAPPIMPSTTQGNTGFDQQAAQGPLPGQMGDPGAYYGMMAPSGPAPQFPMGQYDGLQDSMNQMNQSLSLEQLAQRAQDQASQYQNPQNLAAQANQLQAQMGQPKKQKAGTITDPNVMTTNSTGF